jgi:uncharacterized protein (DUF1697 family)
MANRQIALLRGINVGRAKRVAMADLRAMMEDLGFRDVKTLLNSGNVVYTAGRDDPRKVGTRIEKALAAAVGVSSRVTVLTADELDEVVRGNPLSRTATDPSRLLVAFFSEPSARTQLAPLVRRRWKPEALATGTRAAYLWCASGILESRVLEAVARTVGSAMTTRNWTTVMKLHALATTEREAEAARS